MAQTCTCGTIRLGCMGADVLFRVGPDALETRTVEAFEGLPAGISLDDRLREVETSLISWALKVSKSNKSRAAELLNIKRSTLGDRIARCGLQMADEASVVETAPTAAPLAAAV
jgi:DNA-binding NtrC family response regulator